ncbi:hypothetical protein [Cryptosporangium aurantiacum]|uniref:AAA-like domain-containing protein n=1 Tax=Cryptosporangium aurantiacum TaxID=134849 RepID=A0A1M7PQ97_9ACTN|nr:hypothetical protein [Cryptosporangium aurantiacum]SHN19509.1 hypothetical protein SAMN05443668_103578 [Cryptosporangium aurantiacum]
MATLKNRASTAPVRGWRGPGAGRASTVPPTIEYQGTTVQVCGLFPFVAGSGAPIHGVPIGRHLVFGEPVGLDPMSWLDAGLVTNPGMFVLGQPGVGKSALVKRLVTGNVAFGRTALILGDLKPDYAPLVRHLGGQVIPVARGKARINPLDSGPLAAVLSRLSGARLDRLRLETRSRRLALLLALCALVRRRPVSNGEEILLGRVVDLLAERLDRDPTIPDVVAVLAHEPDELRSAARLAAEGDYRTSAADLVPTLALLCDGVLKGVFDGPTSTPIDLAAPAVSVDISGASASGDQLIAAAMLSVWSYGFAAINAATLLAEEGLAPRRQWLAIMDELWRALRGAPGLVDHADSLTRLNRQLGVGSVMITHSLDDLDALPTEERAKARGFVERAAIKVLGALPRRELDRVGQVIRLTAPERSLVASWAAPELMRAGSVHPGRGKYLIKTGDGPGIPVSMALVDEEPHLYDTDAAVRRPGRPALPSSTVRS